MALIHLIYVSSARGELPEAELDSILEASARNNAARNITGMLLYVAGSFMQLLEGEEADVEAVYRKVESDPRHHGVIVLERAPIEARSFGKWSMGFKRISSADAAAHPHYAKLVQGGFDADGIGAKPGLALSLLKDFGSTQRA